MSDRTPWYVEHSKKPKGPYGARLFSRAAEDNPEKRRGVALYHHSDYESPRVQRAIAQGLAILRESPERVVMVGGDLPSGRQFHHHIRWNPDERTYEIVEENRRNRIRCKTVVDVYEELDDLFPNGSFVCVLLIYVKNSPFNLPEERTGSGTIIGA